MASETKDPREAVLVERVPGGDRFPRSEHIYLLRELDAADPLRAMLGNVVEALERIAEWTPEMQARAESHHAHAIAMWRGCVGDAATLLTKLRTLTPTCANCGGRGIVAACSDPTGEDPEAVWWDTHCADCSTLTPTEGGTYQ